MPGSSASFDVVVVGVSAGGVDLLLQWVPALPADFPAPIVICLHSGIGTTDGLVRLLARRSRVKVHEAHDKDVLAPGDVYLAPGGYHLLLEREGTVSLSLDAPVRFARPSIDVLFDSAAHAFGKRVLAVVMSGANDDGADGCRRVKAARGTVIVQDPDTARAPDMPRAAMAAVEPDHTFKPGALPALLSKLCKARKR